MLKKIMSTRSSIKIEDQWDTFYVYLGSDGGPENVMPDLERVIEEKKTSWSGSEAGLLTTSLLMILNDVKNRFPDYSITTGIHGDEQYFYEVRYENKQWKAYLVNS